MNFSTPEIWQLIENANCLRDLQEVGEYLAEHEYVEMPLFRRDIELLSDLFIEMI